MSERSRVILLLEIVQRPFDLNGNAVKIQYSMLEFSYRPCLWAVSVGTEACMTLSLLVT